MLQSSAINKWMSLLIILTDYRTKTAVAGTSPKPVSASFKLRDKLAVHEQARPATAA